MDRRRLLQIAPLALGGALLPGAAFASDPKYVLTVGADALTLGPAKPTLAPARLESLQGAIDLAVAAGKRLYLLPGTYEASELVVSGPVEIAATAGTAILAPAGAFGLNLDIRPAGGAATIEGVVLRGLKFSGGRKPFLRGTPRPLDPFLDKLPNFNAMVTAERAVGLVIDSCIFVGSASGALALWQCRNARVTGNRFEANSLAIHAHNGFGSLFADNRIEASDNYGVYLSQWPFADDFSVVRDNVISGTRARQGATPGRFGGSGPYGNAIVANGSAHLTVAGNSCYDQDFSGIRLAGCSHFVVSDNHVVKSGETAVMIECPTGKPGPANGFRYEGGVIANNVVSDAAGGISVTNVWFGGRRVIVSGNEVKTITRRTIATTDPDYPAYTPHAVGIWAEGDVVVSANLIEDCDGAGVFLDASPIAESARRIVVSAIGNTIKNCLYGVGFEAKFSQCATLIESNMIEGARKGALMWIVAAQPFPLGKFEPGDGVDYGLKADGLYTGKPYPNVMIGQNFAI